MEQPTGAMILVIAALLLGVLAVIEFLARRETEPQIDDGVPTPGGGDVPPSTGDGVPVPGPRAGA